MSTRVKNRILSKIKNIHLKRDGIDDSVLSGVRQPLLFSSVLDKPSGYKVFCEPETIHFKEIIISVLNTITNYLEDDINEEVDFNVDFHSTNDRNSNY